MLGLQGSMKAELIMSAVGRSSAQLLPSGSGVEPRV